MPPPRISRHVEYLWPWQRGVALRTTHGPVREALQDENEIYGSTVEYADYTSTYNRENNLLLLTATSEQVSSTSFG